MRTLLPLLLGLVFTCNAMAATPGPQRVRLDGEAGGKRFEGIGVVDGGGATSVLLKDYPEPQRSQILDLLYKPKFGASVSVLYVEIPGDGNSTQGAMPSHMHTRDDLNYQRGYTWWIMSEARKRNPALALDGTAWSAPGWLGDSGNLLPSNRRDQGDRRFFSQDTADYYIQWLKGLRGRYGLEMDALGMRNEKGVSYATLKAMRRALDANGFGKVRLHAFDNWPDGWKFDFVQDLEGDAALRDAVAIIGAHVNSDKSTVPASVREQAEKLGKPLWNTEGHVYKAGYEGLIGIVKSFNDNYVKSGITRVVNWYGIAGLYTMEPYSGEKEAALRANWPWSGHYEPNPSLWGYAHYGQFSEIGWTWLKGASGLLDAGGSYVTLKSPGKDYSVIVETAGAGGPQQLRLEIGAGLSGAALAVWRSNAKDYFVRQADLAPVDGALTLNLEPDTVYSLTTTRGQRKGGFDAVPALSAFPFPYHEDFEGYADARQWGYLPRYFADIAGAFELAACPQRKGQCLRQAAPVPTISWAPDWQPYTILGDERWADYEVSADVYLNPTESAGVMGRVNHVGTGYGIIPKGYYLQLAADGELKLVVVRGKIDKKALVGDAEQQALIKAGLDAGAAGEKVLATTRLPGVGAGQWHRLRLQFKDTAITASVDGQPVLAATDTLYANGMAGLLAGVTSRKTLSTPWFDHVVIAPPGSPSHAPAPAVAARGQAPLYPK